MKYLRIILITVFIINLNNLYSDEFQLDNVTPEYIGTYVPVQYENLLSNTKNHYAAMLANNNKYHDILLLNDDICYSDANFHDGYAIKKSDFENYNFINNDTGYFIIDNNGNSYRKISNNIGSEGYIDFYNYVLNQIFSDAKSYNNIRIDKDRVYINNIDYKVILDSVFFETDNVSVWIRGNGNTYALVINEISAKLYQGKYEHHSCYVSDIVGIEFPLFTWGEENYPKLDLSNKSKLSLRYLRNLVYAKHGYIFRSEELQKLYENFNWYSPNTNFSEDSFSKEEKRLLERIIRIENNN